MIAILAAGAAIDLSGRVTSTQGASRLAWLTGGAFAMGTGIWSMHYIGMLAFELPVEVRYDWPTVLLSLFAAMCASWVSLFVVSRSSMSQAQAVLGSIFMGSGIAAMHYIGMEVLMRQACIDGAPFDAALLDHQMPECDGEQLGKLIVADPQLKATRLVLLTSSGQRGGGKHYAEIGFAGYLLKPVTLREMNECLTLVLAAPAEAWHMRSQSIITQEALQSQRMNTRAQILLAEDNPVNQKVAVRLLEKLGYRVNVASDGNAAVAAWADGGCDLVLMDCQMPELDGYEATREIRRRESADMAAPLRRTPIIALTADALKGTEAMCRAAGMDGYLSKPIDRDLLGKTLAEFIGAPYRRERTIASHS